MRPGSSSTFSYPRLIPALTRPDLIEHNYDLMIKYANRDPAGRRLHRGAAAAIHQRNDPPRRKLRLTDSAEIPFTAGRHATHNC